MGGKKGGGFRREGTKRKDYCRRSVDRLRETEGERVKDDGQGCRKMKADGDQFQDDEMKTSSVHHAAGWTLVNLPARNNQDGGGGGRGG